MPCIRCSVGHVYLALNLFFDQVATVNQYFDERKTIFEDHVTAKQQAFNIDTMDLENKVRNFGQYTDVGKIRLIAEKAKNNEVKLNVPVVYFSFIRP